jgi:hypothetical protein
LAPRRNERDKGALWRGLRRQGRFRPSQRAGRTLADHREATSTTGGHMPSVYTVDISTMVAVR